MWTLRFASDWDFSEPIKINSLSDLETLWLKYHKALIVDFSRKEILVYDYYIE